MLELREVKTEIKITVTEELKKIYSGNKPLRKYVKKCISVIEKLPINVYKESMLYEFEEKKNNQISVRVKISERNKFYKYENTASIIRFLIKDFATERKYVEEIENI